MIDKQQWSLKNIAILIFSIVLVLLLNGAIPFLLTPPLGQAIWSMGLAQSFANGAWYDIYSHDLGIPQATAVAFGLSGIWPASMLLRLGLHPSDAYSSMFALYLILAFFSAYTICVRLGIKRAPSILGSLTWMSMPIIWSHNGYSMVALGIGLLPFYLLQPLKICGWFTGKPCFNRTTFFLYFVVIIISIFMDGYSFMMFAVGSSFIFVHAIIFRHELRQSIVKMALPLHMTGFILAYILYVSYIGKFNYAPYQLNFFRGFGLDLSFIAIPTQNVSWFFDLLGISVQRSDLVFFGDDSVWITTFCLPIVLAGLAAWWRITNKKKLATGALITMIFGFYMALGPSLKINSTKPEALAISHPGQESSKMPSELAIVPTGNALLSLYVPGFNVMRASYRWAALGIFSLWLLLMIKMANTSRDHEKIWIIISICIITLNLPNLVKKWQDARDSRLMFHQVDHDLIQKMSPYFSKNEIVAFLPFDNDFMVNYLAPKIGIKTYNIGGDKNLEEARTKWPESLSEINFDFSPYDFGALFNILLTGDVDAVVIPYFNLGQAAYSWPCESESLIGVRTNGFGWNKNIVATSDDSQEIKLPITSSVNVQNIYINVPKATSPRELSGAPDDRILGIALQNIQLSGGHSFENKENSQVSDFYSFNVGSTLKDRISILAQGWHNTEKDFIWSDKSASLVLPVPTVCFSDECQVALKFSVFGASSQRPVEVNFSNSSENCPAHFKDRVSNFVEMLKASPYLTVQDSDLLSIIRLRPEFAEAAKREALRTAVINNITYPLIFGNQSTWATLFLQSGWNPLEADHVWSKQKSTLRLPVPKDCVEGSCSAALHFYVYGSSAARPVLVKFSTMQSGKIWQKELISISDDDYRVSLPLSHLEGNQQIEISVPQATSPHNLGINEDIRTIGIALEKIELIRH
jgi:hypothetical protein